MNNTIVPITSKLLTDKKIIHGFFTRNGNINKNYNLNFNCSLKNNKFKNKILENRKMVTNYHNLGIKNLKTVNQIHSNKVLVIENYNQETKIGLPRYLFSNSGLWSKEAYFNFYEIYPTLQCIFYL